MIKKLKPFRGGHKTINPNYYYSDEDWFFREELIKHNAKVMKD